MLQKMYVRVEEYKLEYKFHAVVLLVDTLDEVLAAQAILKSQMHKFRSLQLKSSLFLSVPHLDGITAFSIVLEDAGSVEDILKRCQGKYVELIVPYALFSEKLLKQCERADRVIISFCSEEELLGLNDVFKACITFRRFPLMQNVPLCKIDVKFASEIYMRKEAVLAKPKSCGGCLLQKYCSFEGRGFVPVPIVDSEKYAGVLAFLANEDSTARF